MSTSLPESAVLRRAVQGAALALMLLLAPPAEAGLTQQWYLYRARSNLDIKNYKAAIEAYRKVLEDDPHHREALKGLGTACEANGQTDEAIAAYDRYLQRYPDDADVAFKQARVLGWERYAYRRADAIRYYRLGLRQREEPGARHALAKLLAQDKATLDEALAEYRTLLKQRPQDAALREEYRKLLLWDERHLGEATAEWGRLAAERPQDRAVALQHARLLARSGRTTEAAERYRPLVERSPKDRALRLELARVLARDPARNAEALAQLEQSLGPKPDYETRLLHADLLARDEARRDEAVERYRQLAEERPKDRAVALKHAQLLSAKKESSPDAIAEYERVVAADPDNAEAHEGLARAYAWNGDQDRALHHNRLALARASGQRQRELRALETELASGREPRTGAGASVLVQPGEGYGLTGLRLPLRGRAELSAFVTAHADAGFESYWGTGRSAAGVYGAAASEVRFSPEQRARLELGYHSVRPGVAGLRGRLEYEHHEGALMVRPRFERAPRSDSFGALTGEDAVSTNALSVLLERRWGALRAWTTPLAGVVTGSGSQANLQLGIEAGGEVEVLASETWHLALGYDAQLSHYGRDAGGERAGYYSPALHLVQTPRLTLQYAVARELFLELGGGPSLQYQLAHGESGGAWLPGAQAHLGGTFRLGERLEALVGASVIRMGDAYLRVEAGGSLNLLF